MMTIFDALADIGFPVGIHTAGFQIRCPIHKSGEEAKPSARVYPETNSIYCFTCGKSWNPVALIAAANEWEYFQARAYVQQRYGGVDPDRPTDQRWASQLLYDTLLAVSKLEGSAWLAALRGMDTLLVTAAHGDSDANLSQRILAFRAVHFGLMAGPGALR